MNNKILKIKRGPQTIFNFEDKNSKKKREDEYWSIPITRGGPTSHIMRQEANILKTKIKSQ